MFRCPDRYPNNDTVLPSTPPDWKGVGAVSGKLLLSNAGVLIGPFKDRGELRGSERKTKDGHETHFGLNKIQEPSGKWIYCAYGLGGEVLLLTRADDTSVQCTVKNKRVNVHGTPEIFIICT